jgi:hypothetical protein
MANAFGHAFGAVLYGALGFGYAVLLERGCGALLAHDWDAADKHFRAIAPAARLLEERAL